jgi:hypothetical protein
LTTIAVLLASVAVLVVGCTGESTSAPQGEPARTSGEETTPVEETTMETSLCEKVPKSLVRAIESGLTVQGGGQLKGAKAVKSNDFESVYYVSAELQGPGLEGSGDIATWATNSLKAGEGLILAADAVAKEFSDWGADVGEGSAPAETMSLDNDGAEESRACVTS